MNQTRTLHSAQVALDAFTPVDASVYRSLTTAARERHADDMAKRLSVAAELSRAGACHVVEQVLAEPDRADVVGDLDALVEFGRLPDDLTDEQPEQAARAPIPDDVLPLHRN